MNTITIITGNENKLKEIKSIFQDLDLTILNKKCDLDEIQSLNIKQICEHKVKQAYKIVKQPVIIEDTSAIIDELNGLPGPFIKFFEERLGSKALIILANSCASRNATIINNATFYDGKTLIQTQGKTKGKISKSLAQGEGFGFDFCFIPNGFEKTFSELGTEIKKKNYGRKKALINLKKELVEKKFLF